VYYSAETNIARRTESTRLVKVLLELVPIGAPEVILSIDLSAGRFKNSLVLYFSRMSPFNTSATSGLPAYIRG
jgi:hypothetical protein